MNRVYRFALLALALVACNKAANGPDTTPPSAPTSLKASQVKDTNFLLSWLSSTDDSGVASYDVFKDGVKAGSTPNTQLAIICLAPKTKYSFTVKAIDKAGNVSPPSTALEVTTLDKIATGPAAPLSPPTGLKASNLTSTSLTLSWTAPSGTVAFYDVYKDGVKETTVTSDKLSADIANLKPGTTYSFTVRSLDTACNTSADSAALSVKTADAAGGGSGASESELSAATVSYDASASKVRDGTNAEIASYLSDLNAPFSLKLANFLGLPDFFSQVGGLIGAQSVRAQADTTLPRGNWDCTSGNCAQTPGDDYYVKWKTSSGKLAEIYFDWDGSSVPPASPTVTGHPASDLGSNIEAPTKLIAWLKLDGTKLMDLTRTVKYPSGSCGPIIDVPDAQKLVLSLKRADGSNILNVKNFETSIGSDNIVTKGDIAASAGGEGITATWSLTTTGTVLRLSCGQYGGLPANNLVGSAITSNGKYTLEFSVAANRFTQNPASITFTDSTLKVGGKPVKFVGSTEDKNKDGYIGDDLTLTFGGGQTMSLETYLKKYHAKK